MKRNVFVLPLGVFKYLSSFKKGENRPLIIFIKSFSDVLLEEFSLWLQ